MNWDADNFNIKTWVADNLYLTGDDYAYLIDCGCGVRTEVRPGTGQERYHNVVQITTANETQESQMLLLLSGKVKLKSYEHVPSSIYNIRFNL
jgi:hypothetical protein